MSNLAQMMQELKDEGIKLGFEINISVNVGTYSHCSQTTPVAVEAHDDFPAVEEKEPEVEEKPAPKKRTRKKPVPKKEVVEELPEEEEQGETESEEQVEEAEEITIAALTTQTRKAIKDHGKVVVKSILEEFAISKLTELDAEYYADFAERLGEECP